MTLDERVALLEEEVRYLRYKLLNIKLIKYVINENEYVDSHGESVDKSKAAILLGVTRATVYQMIKDGRLVTTHEGRRVSTRSIFQYMHRENKNNAED